jgi:hypothetical protein
MSEIQKYSIVFFAGGETRDNQFNIFTGSFIRLLSNIFEDSFTLIRGIYFRFPMFNVIWGLNNSQKPLTKPGDNKIISSAFKQLCEIINNKSVLILISSSSGGIVAAQTACYLAEETKKSNILSDPFHLVIGTCFLSKESDLYLKLIDYQSKGIIGSIIFDDLQDKEDNIAGIGGRSRREAYSNAFGLMFPFISGRFDGPSFLNTHPEKGHHHRKRSQTFQKAKDFINVIFIHNKLAGEIYAKKAVAILEAEDKKTQQLMPDDIILK